jgi:uncharacterized membrane protein YqjE
MRNHAAFAPLRPQDAPVQDEEYCVLPDASEATPCPDAGMDSATLEATMRYLPPRTDDAAHHANEGVRTSVKQIISASGRYASARVRLMLLETRLAAMDVKKATIFLGIAAAGALTGFVMLAAGLVLWIARLFLNGNTAAASALTGAVLLGIAALFTWTGLRSVRGKSFYPVTRTELNRDKQWLHKLP